MKLKDLTNPELKLSLKENKHPGKFH